MFEDQDGPKTAETGDVDNSEATSSKTLSEIEETNRGSGSVSNDSSPSPDGQFDETDEKEKADPI
jgi:hypothetical protein